MKESHRRSISKAISWRALTTVVTMLIVFFFTGDVIISVSVGAVEVVVKIIIYYLHERAWNRVKWGKKK